MRTGEITIQARLHLTGLWITVPVTVGDAHRLLLVLDSGSPISALNPEVRDWLALGGLLQPGVGAGTHRLAMTAAGQAMPDLEVRVLPQLVRLRVQGLIGLNYLRAFESVHVHIPTLTVTLQLPKATG